MVTIRDLQQVMSPTTDLNGVTVWTSIESREAFYVIWGSRDGGLTLAQFNGPFGETTVLQRFYDERFSHQRATKMRYFVETDFMGLVVAYASPVNPETTTLAVYHVNRTVFSPKQVLSVKKADMDLIQDRHLVYLAISDDRNVRVLVWTGTQFDEVASRAMSGVTSIKIMRISSDIFIATAQGDSKLPSQSQLLLYKPLDKRRGELKSHQVLETKFKYDKVSFFAVAGSYYLVYSGSELSTVYWWVSDGFLEFQTLHDSQAAIDVFPMRLIDGEVLLILLFQNRIAFYTQSADSRFTLVHQKLFDSSIRLSGVHVASYAGKFVYAFLAYQQSVPSAPVMRPIWKIRLIPYYPVHGSRKEDILSQCLTQLTADLVARDTLLRDLARKVDRVWVTSRSQTVTAPVLVKAVFASRVWQACAAS